MLYFVHVSGNIFSLILISQIVLKCTSWSIGEEFLLACFSMYANRENAFHS